MRTDENSVWIVRGELGKHMEAEQMIMRMARVFTRPYRIYTENDDFSWDPGIPVDICMLPKKGVPKEDKVTAIISLWDWMPRAWSRRAGQLGIHCIETEEVEGGCVVKEH